jgi:hypothetical protein
MSLFLSAPVALAQTTPPTLTRLPDILVGNGPHSVVEVGPISPVSGDMRPGLAVANSGENDPATNSQCVPGQDSVSILYQATDTTGAYFPFANDQVSARVVDEAPVALAAGAFRSASNPRLDIITANKCADSHNVLIYRPENDLRYVQPAGSPIRLDPMDLTTERPVAVTAGQMNNDAHLDFVAVYNATGRAQTFLGNGSGQFTAAAGGISLASPPVGAALGHFNSDSILDLIVAAQGNTATGIGGGITLAFGDGQGGFQPITQSLSTGSGARSVALADFNKDGRNDVVVANQQDDSISLVLRSPTGDGLTSALRFATQPGAGCTVSRNGRRNCPDQPGFIATADLNGDTLPDVLAVMATGNALVVYNGTGSFPFLDTPQRISLSGCTRPISLATPDLELDGDPDVVIACLESDRLAILRNDTP